MGRSPCCEKVGLRRGRWTEEEDQKLRNYILANGEGSWKSLPRNAGLLRCGKSCRLRWVNYLRSDLKRGKFSAEEDEIIINLHASMGNKWSVIAGVLPGRTDNEIKNYWNSHLGRRIDSYRKRNTNFVVPPPKPVKKKSKTKPHKNHNSSDPTMPCTAPTPPPSTSTNISFEKDTWIPRIAGMDSHALSLDDLLGDVDGISRTMEEAEMEKDNKECPDGDTTSVNIPGSSEINCDSPVNVDYIGGVGWDLDFDLGNQQWGQEHNTLFSDEYSEMVAWILSQ